MKSTIYSPTCVYSSSMIQISLKMSTSIWYMIFLLICVENAFSGKKLYAPFDRIEVCGQPPNPRVKYENFTISVANENWTCSADLEIFGDPIPSITITVNIRRCANREAPDTCQDYHKLTTANGCQFLLVDGMIWSPFIKAVKPEFKCPISGKYRQINAWLDIDSFQWFPIEKYYWKLMFTVSVHRIHMMSLCLEGMVYRRKNT